MRFHAAAISGLAILIAFTAASLSAAEAMPVRIVSEDAVASPRQPQVAIDEAGTIFVAFGASDAIYCCTSADRGQTYSDPVKIGSLPKLSLGMRRGPRIVARHDAAEGDFLVVTAISHDSGNLVSWRSTDAGKTWQGPLTVNDSPKDAREGLHAMTISPAGQIFCTWLDLRNKSTELFASVSTDGGKSWSKNFLVYHSPSGSICECCHPSVACDSNGDIYVMWRNSIDGFRDMYASRSRDGGKTFTAAAKLGPGTWKLDACPMDGGYLAATAPGKLTTIWRRNTQIFRSDIDGTNQQPREQLLGNGEQPWAAATSAGAYLVWVSRRPGDLWLATPKSKSPDKIAADATDPVITAPLKGNGPLVIAWESGPRGKTSLHSLVIAP